MAHWDKEQLFEDLDSLFVAMLVGKCVDDVVTLQTAEGPLTFGVVSIV